MTTALRQDTNTTTEGGTLMPVHLREHQCCTVPRCLRPAREPGGYCTSCWRGLSPEARRGLQWEADLDAQPTEQIDTPAILRAVAELTADLDAWAA